MVNFLIQINYLVLVLVTIQIEAGKIFKTSNETYNELANTETASLLPFNSTDHSGLTKGRDNYSYYYGEFTLGYVFTFYPVIDVSYSCSWTLDMAHSTLFLALVCLLHYFQRF